MLVNRQLLASTTTRLQADLVLVASEAVRSVCVMQVYHEMVVLEQIHRSPDVGPGVSLQAITSQPLMLQ